jgi:flagellar hook assembly protein FlgD
VSISIYNSAGERVATLYQGPAQTAQQQPIISTGAAGAGPVSVDISGFVTSQGSSVHWDGQNSNGQWVQDGTYYVQMTSTDSFGAVKSSSVAVAVVGAPRAASIQIYNSAGELVRTLPVSSINGVPSDLDSNTRAFSTVPDPVTGKPQGGLSLNVKVGTSTQAVVWDGLSDRGQPVDSGTYVVKLTYTDSGSATVVKTLSVTYLQSPDSSAKTAVASAFVAPNPYRPSTGQDMVLFYQASPMGVGAVRVYDLNGGLVGQSADGGQTGRIVVKPGSSEGIYLIDFEIRSGSAVLARRVLKVAVVR